MDVETLVADVPVIMQLEFQQFYQFVLLKVPQIQFLDRVSDMRVLTVQTMQQNVMIPQVQLLACPLWCNYGADGASLGGRRS